MPHPRLPPEISDYIADLLHDKPRTLKRCCLVSKSWVPRARKHLFGRIKFRHPAEVDAWKKIFPDPANSPGYHTHSLSFRCAEVFTIADAEEGGWIQAFSNVVRLRVLNSGTRKFRPPSTALESACIDDAIISSSNFLALICSLPVLQDLDVGYLKPGGSDDVDIAIFRPSTSPPLTGTLSLTRLMADNIRCPTRRLTDLPIRFRRLEYEWWREKDLPWIRALIEACCDTLESILVEDETDGKPWFFRSCHAELAPTQTRPRARSFVECFD